ELGPAVEVLEQADGVALFLLLGPGKERLAGSRRTARAFAPSRGLTGFRSAGLAPLGPGRAAVVGFGGHPFLNEGRSAVTIEVARDSKLDRRAFEAVAVSALLVVAGVGHAGIAPGIGLGQCRPIRHTDR